MGWVLHVAVSEEGVKGSTLTDTGIVAKLNLNWPSCGNHQINDFSSKGKHFPDTIHFQNESLCFRKCV